MNLIKLFLGSIPYIKELKNVKEETKSFRDTY